LHLLKNKFGNGREVWVQRVRRGVFRKFSNLADEGAFGQMDRRGVWEQIGEHQSKYLQLRGI
jgi:hypothetical protein